MDPVDSNSSNGFISASYPLDLVNQAREVVLGANRELFLVDTADTSDTPAEFSQLSARLNEFSTLLSSTDFFSEDFSSQSQTEAAETEDSTFAETLEDGVLDETGEAFSSSLDLDAKEQSVRTVINEYNGLVEWLDSSQYSISSSLKADLFKDMNSDVLEGIISGTSPALKNATPHVNETESQARQTDHSPHVSRISDSTVESALSEIGLTLNTDGTLDVEEEFEQQFKTNFSRAHDVLSGEEGFFTKISSFLDAINNRDSRFNVYDTRNTQVYTHDTDAQVRNAYRTNVASLLNTFA